MLKSQKLGITGDMSTSPNTTRIARPPVIAVMGHVDHGKSTLLDYIRKANTVASEAGGITQHLSAYEVRHIDNEGNERLITFLDTPGHEAFTSMRVRGASIADLVILVVAADDGVKPQTLEALDTIKKSNTPFIVAINKIDKPGADIERTKGSLVEHEIYIEGYGGQIPCVPISAKQGTGISDLLDTVLLAADLEEFVGDVSKPAEGVVLEAHRDPKSGISATLLIKDGSIKKGQFVVAGNAIAGTRMFQDFTAKNIEYAQCSSPVIITGWDNVPPVGEIFSTYETKKEAEAVSETVTTNSCLLIEHLQTVATHETKLVPLIIKTDVLGTYEAIEKELCKLQRPEVAFKLIHRGVGDISESDINFAKADSDVLIIGFNVKTDKLALELNEQVKATISTFSIIYKLTEWAEEELEKRRPRKEIDEKLGEAKVLKVFSQNKKSFTLGGEVTFGILKTGTSIIITHKDETTHRGKLEAIQQNKIPAKEVREGLQFGAIIETDGTLVEGDIITSVTKIIK